MLQVRYGALLSKADPHCAVVFLGEVPPWGVMLRLGEHACCQLLCNVRAEPANPFRIGTASPRTAAGEEGGGGETTQQYNHHTQDDTAHDTCITHAHQQSVPTPTLNPLLTPHI